MQVVEGTYENGQLRLDNPVAYQQPMRVRVEFLEELSAAVRPPLITDPVERMNRLQASWDKAQALTSANSGPTLSELVIAARQE